MHVYIFEGCNECCQAGGSCGDAVFDDCVGGSWDYRITCSPSYHVCCVPSNPTRPTSTTSRTHPTTSSTHSATPSVTPPSRPDSPAPSHSPPVSSESSNYIFL